MKCVKARPYNDAHAQTCKEQGITAELEKRPIEELPFYTQDAEAADITESLNY